MAKTHEPGRPDGAKSVKRVERLAAQLRENLKKRKEQSRLRGDGRDATRGDEPGDDTKRP